MAEKKKKSNISKGMMEDYTGPDIIQEDAPVEKPKKDKVHTESDRTKGLKHGGKVGRGCGSAMKGGGSVMKAGKQERL